MKKFFAIILFVISILISNSQEKLDYFLPTDITYNQNIPTPEQFFGQQIGEWHLTYDQVLFYMKEIDRVSDRAVLKEYARSWENRPLVNLIFTSPENQKNLSELREKHLKYSNPNENIDKTGVPLVISLGYGVHGNESSATNSSVLTVYYLAATQGDKIDKLLENTIILVDPCLNPDGFTRHSTWANTNQGETVSGDRNSRQFNEVWPGGRGNHYWFDLNRDYLLLVHPESVGRVANFHEWLPNIVTDHHEMGSGSTFFFQPGVPTRNNPLTPANNYILTSKIAAYHAKYLDKIGSSYFSEEQFDDYYLGKGSSYPDINSGIGILFEQAGFRGRVQETANGLRKLSFGIRNQFTVTLSTLEAALELRDELLGHQKEFYVEALQLAEKDQTKAYIFGNEDNKLQSRFMAELLLQHKIDVFQNEKTITKNGITYLSGNSFVVPLKQKQYRLIKAVFERVSAFSDSTFYDVSTWNFPGTFNVSFDEITSLKEIQFSVQQPDLKINGKIIGGKSNVGYLFKWNEYTSPKALYELQSAGLTARVATEEFSFETDGKLTDFTYGTILIKVNDQRLNEAQIFNVTEKVARENGMDFYSLTTGLSQKGIDLGSNSFVKVSKPVILEFVGGNTGSGSAGEIWHLFDQRYKIPVTITETNSLSSIDISKYNTIILPEGSYREWTSNEIQKIKTWTQEGGILIATQNAAEWAAKNEIGKLVFKKPEKPDSTLNFKYADREKEKSLNTISGAIFNTTLDITHPLCYGYSEKTLPVFKTGTTVAKTLGTQYTEPVKFTDNPFISGFVSDKNLNRIKNAPVVTIQAIGRGKLISYHESMTFRGIWLGTNKLFANGVFFGNVIQ